jgi:hypothetical protein
MSRRPAGRTASAAPQLATLQGGALTSPAAPLTQTALALTTTPLHRVVTQSRARAQSRVSSPKAADPWQRFDDLVAGSGIGSTGTVSLPGAPGAVLILMALLALFVCVRVRPYRGMVPRTLLLSNPAPPG